MAEILSMPKLGFDMAEGALNRWVIGEGEAVVKGAIIVEIETDKATVEVEAGVSGIVARHLVKEGDLAPVGAPIAVIAQEGETVDYQALGLGGAVQAPAAAQPTPAAAEPAAALPAAQTAGAAVEAAQPETGIPGGVRASPLARRMAGERGIDLRLVRGSGPGGRIVKADVANYRPTAPVPAAPAPRPEPAPLAVQPGAAPEDKLIPLTKLRSAIGRRMVEAKQQAPHFYVTHEYKMEALLDLRKQVNALLPEEEKISVNDFIVRAVALTLRSFPNLNASLQGAEIRQHGHVNIGVAVALDSGLLTVVCKDADAKPVRQIGAEVRTMVARAREGKVRPEDIEGSTFSISNLGMFDVEHFIAIINPPEAAILAVGSARETPVVENGEIKVGLRMKITISVDHRVSDGAEAAQFLKVLAQFLEQPLRLMI